MKVPFSGLWTGITLVRGEEICLIDSGATAEDVDRYLVPGLAELGLGLQDITWLLNTHSHGDHIGGHARIRNLANLKVAAHRSSAPKVEQPVPYAIETRTRFPEYSPPPQSYLQGVAVDRILEDGEILAGRLQVIHTPGHDDDCVCWFDRVTGTLITGDSLQGNGTPAQGVGFYKDLEAYRTSVRRLLELGPSHILCGHEYDGMGWDIRGDEACRAALSLCEDRTDCYHSFVMARYREGQRDPAEIARALIRAEGCGMPDKLFLALYTVTQHLDKINKFESEH